MHEPTKGKRKEKHNLITFNICSLKDNNKKKNKNVSLRLGYLYILIFKYLYPEYPQNSYNQ